MPADDLLRQPTKFFTQIQTPRLTAFYPLLGLTELRASTFCGEEAPDKHLISVISSLEGGVSVW